MRMSMYKALCIALAGFMLIGCTDDAKHDAPMNNTKTKTFEVSDIITDSELTDEQKAEKLARGAEELALGNPAAFMYADEVLNSALRLDANNKRAQFYKVVLAPAMTLRGMATRVMPIATAEEIKEGLENLKKESPKSVYDFLTEGAQDIRNEADLQKHIDSQTQAYENARLFFKSNKDMKLTLYVPANMAIGAMADQEPNTYWHYDYASQQYVETKDISDVQHCIAEQKDNGDIEYRVCTTEEITERTLEAGDIEALQNSFAALKIQSSLANSYSLNGGFEFGRTQQDLGENKMGAQAGYKYLSKTDSFATLRDSEAFAGIKAMGADAIKGVRYIMANQDTLCPVNRRDTSWWMDVSTRPGKLFNYGLCIEDKDEVTRQLARLENALKGETTEMKWTSYTGELKSTDIRTTALIDNPISDLKTLDPKFNPCGQVINVSDDSLGGTFVNNDVNTVLWETQEYCGEKFDQFYEDNKEKFENAN